jgi:periplasmic protein TonB
MTAAITYKNLALGWQPSQQIDSDNFNKIVMSVLLFATILLLVISFIDVPETNNRTRVAAPDRIAEFISRKEKPIVKPPKPEVKPLPKLKEEPLPTVEPVPTEELPRVTENERKPLTESQKQARKVAEKSGLLALANELNDLIDNNDVQNKMTRNLSAELPGTNASNVASGHDVNAISTGAAQSGGAVDAGQYTGGKVGGMALELRDSEKITGELLAGSNKDSANGKKGTTKNQSGAGSAGEDVTIVFDKNKGGLYSLYERERRTTPGLQGKIVLQLIISPEGNVIDVKIISSELNNPALEAKLISRIKLFKFKGGGEKPITITYPIEFLPS